MHEQASQADSQISDILWDRYFKAGQAAMRLKNTREAQAMFKMALQKCDQDQESKRLETTRWLAMTLMEQKDYGQAQALLDEMMHYVSTKYGPVSHELIETTLTLCGVLEKQGHYNDACAMLRKLMREYSHSDRSREHQDYQLLQRRYIACDQMRRDSDEGYNSRYPY